MPVRTGSGGPAAVDAGRGSHGGGGEGEPTRQTYVGLVVAGEVAQWLSHPDTHRP